MSHFALNKSTSLVLVTLALLLTVGFHFVYRKQVSSEMESLQFRIGEMQKQQMETQTNLELQLKRSNEVAKVIDQIIKED